MGWVAFFAIWAWLLLEVLRPRDGPNVLEPGLAPSGLPERLSPADVAARLGLELQEGALVGHWDGVPVRISERSNLLLKRALTSIHLEPARCDLTFACGPRRLVRDQLPSPEGRVTTGDEGFDSTFEVAGEEAYVTATLGEAGRRALAHFCALGGSVANGQLTVVHVGGIAELGLALRDKLHAAVRESRLLVVGQERVERVLAENVRTDPHPGVRVRNLEVLHQIAPRSAEVRAALQNALRSGVPELVLAAAQLGQCPEALLAVMVLAKAGTLDVRTDALRHLLDHYPLGDQRDVLNHALSLRGSEVQALVATKLGDLIACRDPDALALDPLSAPTERELCDLLLGEDTDLAAAAARILGVAGSVRALARLRAASESTHFRGHLANAAYLAAQRIRERSGRGVGEISVVSPEPLDGAVSDPAPAPGGDLSRA